MSLGRPCARRHPGADDPHCLYCRLFHENAEYRAAWLAHEEGLARNPHLTVRRGPVTICTHRQEPATGEVRQRLGLSHGRLWFRCAKGRGTRGYACPCQGCGPSCPDYHSDPDGDVVE